MLCVCIVDLFAACSLCMLSPSDVCKLLRLAIEAMGLPSRMAASRDFEMPLELVTEVDDSSFCGAGAQRKRWRSSAFDSGVAPTGDLATFTADLRERRVVVFSSTCSPALGAGSDTASRERLSSPPSPDGFPPLLPLICAKPLGDCSSCVCAVCVGCSGKSWPPGEYEGPSSSS